MKKVTKLAAVAQEELPTEIEKDDAHNIILLNERMAKFAAQISSLEAQHALVTAAFEQTKNELNNCNAAASFKYKMGENGSFDPRTLKIIRAKKSPTPAV